MVDLKVAKDGVGYESHFDKHSFSNRLTPSEEESYAYLMTPVNTQTRFGTLRDRIMLKKQKHPDILKLLDIGCGPALLLEQGIDIQYTGVDASLEVIQYAEEKFPDQRFIHGDQHEIMQKMIQNNDCYDFIVLSGVLFNSMDEQGKKLNDCTTLEYCTKLLDQDAEIVLIVPFIYTPGSKKYDFFSQAKWKLNSIQRLLNHYGLLKLVHLSATLQIGVKEAILQQVHFPDWFTQQTELCHHWKGSDMAVWTMSLKKGSYTEAFQLDFLF